MNLRNKVPPPSSPIYSTSTSMTDAEFELSRLKEKLDRALDEQAVSAERNARRVAEATISVAVAAVKSRR